VAELPQLRPAAAAEHSAHLQEAGELRHLHPHSIGTMLQQVQGTGSLDIF
jgi:hypothetical protein